MSYDGRSALVLGATGFVGRHLVRQLQLAGAEVTGAARNPEPGQRAVDATDPVSLTTLLEDVRPEVVFNAIGYGVDRSERDPAVAAAVNDDFVGRLAEALGPKGPRLVHLGSALEYGTISGDLVETSAPHPTTLYGRTKLAGTRRLTEAGLNGITARLFTLYGPGEHAGRLLPTLLEVARTGQPLDFTAGGQRRDFTYVEEVCELLLQLGLSETIRFGEIVNVASGRLTTVRAFIEAAMTVLDIPADHVRFGALPTRPEEMVHDEVNNQRLMAILDQVPTMSVEEGVQRTLMFGHTTR